MYRRTEEGKVIDPPIIPDYEQRIYAAMNAADEREAERLTREYETERTKLADERDKREQAENEDQAARDAEARDAVRNRNAAAQGGVTQ